MGLETLLTVVSAAGAAKKAVDAFSPPSAPGYGPTLTYDQAKTQAGAQLNPMFDQRAKTVQDTVMKDLNNRGFTGQQAGNELSVSTAMDNERQRIAAINGLSNDLMQRSEDNTYRRTALDRSYDIQNRNQVNNDWMDSTKWVQTQPTLPNLKNILKPKALPI